MFTKEEMIFIRKCVNPYTGGVDVANTVADKVTTKLGELEGVSQNLYKFHWYCGRQGDLEGLFKATQEEIDEIIGCSVYFGEVLGKHSEVYGTIDEGEIELVSEDPLTVLNSTESGFNPLEYINDIKYWTKGLNSDQLKHWLEDWGDLPEEWMIDTDEMTEEEKVKYYKEYLNENGRAEEYEDSRIEALKIK